MNSETLSGSRIPTKYDQRFIFTFKDGTRIDRVFRLTSGCEISLQGKNKDMQSVIRENDRKGLEVKVWWVP